MLNFYQYFKENMKGLGLPAPETLFGSASTAVATATTLLSQIDKFGEKVTVAEVTRAGTRLEQLAILGACSAAFYVGAVIGSIAIATGRVLGNGTSISDVFSTIRTHGFQQGWLGAHLHTYPCIYQTEFKGRHLYRCMA